MRAKRVILLCLGIIAIPLHSRAESKATLDQIVGGLTSTFDSAIQDTNKYLQLECVADSAKMHINEFGNSLANTNARIRYLYQNYMKLIGKSIEGNGKCDGGFQAVATEILHRANKTYQTQYRFHEIGSGLRDSIQLSLIDPTITVNHSQGRACVEQGKTGYLALQAVSKQILGRFLEVIGKLQEEEALFRAYQKENEELAANCAEGKRGATGFVTSSSEPSGIQKKGFKVKGSNISEKPGSRVK